MQIIQILLNLGIAFGVDLFYKCEVTTTGEINQKGNYQFKFIRNGDPNNHPQQLYTTYQIQIDFPWTINSDYICYDEQLSPTTCTYSTSTRTIIANYFKKNYLDDDYNLITGFEFQINLDSVSNPSYSGTYDSPIQISIMSSTGIIVEQCPNNGVYPSVLPGTATCSGDGQQSKVSSTNTNIALTILVKNQLAVESYLIVQYTQNWQNDKVTKEIIPGTITCKIFANSILIIGTICTKDSTNLQIKSSLGNGYVANNITIVISGINSPSSTKPVGSFILKTYNSNNKQIDECSTSSVGGWKSNEVILSSLTWTNIINQQGILTFTFQLNSQIVIGDTLIITLPKEIQTSTTTTILQKIADIRSNFFNSQIIYPTFTLSDNVVTITSIKNFNQALYSVTLIFYNVIAPPSIKPTSSITMSTYRDNYIIDQSTSSLTISASFGTLTSITIIAKNKVINQFSDYDINIQLTNQLLSDGYIVIKFPTQFDLNQASTITNYKINSQSYTGALSKSGQNLIISSLFSSTIVGSSQISFTVQQIKNQFSANISNFFSVQTYYSKSKEDYLVDQLTNFQMDSFISGSIDTNSIIIKAENYFTGTQDNYEITFINTNTITANGYILIQIISDITISGNSQSCLINNIISTCNQIDTQTIKIITTISLQANSSIKIQIKQFLINCSTLKILTNIITLKTYDDQDLLIDSGTGGSITMLNLSKFSLTLQNRSSNKNGEKSTYTFQINFQTNQINRIYVLITFPNELQFDLISCTSQSPLNINLPCSITGLVFQIQLNCNTCTLIQMNTDYIFTINSIQNYISFKPISITQAHSIQILTDDTSKQSTLKDILTISNSVINSIKSFTQNNEIGYLQQLDNYSLSISLTNSFINQFKIIIIIPSDIKIQQSTDTNPSTITNIIGLPNDITIQFNQQNLIITGNTLTLINQFQFKINNLMNPSTTTISGHLQINTYEISNNQDYSMDLGQLGTYIHKCTLPCKDCDSTILNKCSSCYDTNRKNLVNQQIYFMEIQNTCLSDCYSVQGYYVGINEYICQKCNDECKTCKDVKSYCLTCNGQYKFLNNQCLTDCPITYYNDQNICKKCIDNCDVCQNNTICQKCSINYYLYQQQCIAQCPQNITITNINQQSCDICTNNCQTCQNNTSYCLTCKNNYYLYKNQCSNSCKDGTYLSDTQCIDCQQKCKTCNNGTSCNSCQQNLLFFQNDCIDKCLDQYYSIDGKCQQCNISCYTCEITQYKCTSCVNNTFLYNNQCLGQCPDEYYNDLNTNKCQKCISPCKTCKSNNLCLSCILQTPTLYYYNNSCNLNCLENYAPENGQCIQCRNPCKQCTLTPDTCSECYPNTYLYNQICVTDCGDGYYQDSQYYVCRQCSSLCKTCKSKNTNCLSCNIGQYLFKSNCVNDCGDGYYSQDQICYECLNKCLTCQNNISCTKCKDNLISYNNDCLTQCPNDLFNEDNTCVSCRSPCLSCSTSPDTCLACISSTYLDSNQKCITDCGDGYFGDEVSNKCLQCKSPCKSCTSNTSCLSCISQIPIFYYYNNSCNTQCQSGYAPENDTCIQCRSPCQTCDTTPDSCLTCVPFTYLSSKKCVTECDDGYFGDSATDSCEKCISPCLTCTSLSKCNSCLKEAANNIYFEGECISACKNGYYEQNGTCIQCTETSTNPACNSTVELIESIQSERFIPMPCTILTLVFIVTVIVAKIHRTETFIPGAISAFGGLFEWGSHVGLLYLSYLEWGLFNLQNFIILGALGINYLLNFVHLILAKCIFHKDVSFQQWLASRAVNKFTYCIITFLGFITTFKINKIVFSRYFGFYFFKARITDVKELISFNVISIISIIFTELPMVLAGVMILNFHDTKDQLYISAIDCIIVSFLILIALIWEAQKEEEYFRESGFQALNQSAQQAYLIDQSNVQPQHQQVEEVLNQSQSIQQVVEATNIQSTNNQKKKLLSQNKSELIFPHKKSSVVPEEDPFFKTQNNDSQSSAKKQKFEEFLKQRTVVPKNLEDQSLNLSSISQDENYHHPFNETSQDKDLLQDYQVLQFQNPEDKITNQVINNSNNDSNFSSELDFNNPPTNQQNTPQNKTTQANKFKKKTKTLQITTVDEDNNDKILQAKEQKLRLKKEEEQRLIQQKIDEEKQRIQREEEQKLELFKKEQQQKEEMDQQQLNQIQMEKEKIEEQKKKEELERIKQSETQRIEKEKILQQEKLLKSQIDEQLRQRKLQEQRELELQKLLDKEKEEKILFQQQLIAKQQREEELKRQEEERKKKEKEELEKLEQIKLELKRKEEQQLLELKLKEEKIKKEKEAEIEILKQELLLQQEQIKIQKQQQELRQRQEKIIKEQKEKEEQERIKQQKEELENQRKLFEQEERKQRELQLALEQQRQKELEQALECQRIQEVKFQELLREKEEIEKKAQEALQNQQIIDNEEVEIIHGSNFNQAPSTPEKQINSSFDEIIVGENQIENDIMKIEDQNKLENLDDQDKEENYQDQNKQENLNDEFQFIAFDEENDEVSQQKEKKKMFLQIQISDEEQFEKRKKQEHSFQDIEEQFNNDDINSRNQVTDYSKQIEFNDPQDQFCQKISSKSITVQRTKEIPQKINKTIQDYSRNKLEQSSQFQFQPKKTNLPNQQNQGTQQSKLLTSQSRAQGSIIGQQSSKFQSGITPNNKSSTHYNFQGTAYNSFAPKTTINKEKDDKYLRQKEEIYLQHIPNYYEKQVQEEMKKKKQQQQRKNLKSSQHNKFEINDDLHLEF